MKARPKNTRTVKTPDGVRPKPCLVPVSCMEQVLSFIFPLMRLIAVFPPLQSLRSRHSFREPFVVGLSHLQDSLATGIAPPPTLPLRLSARPWPRARPLTERSAMDLAVVKPGLVGCCPSRLALSTDRGSDSRLPPNCDAGGSARTDA